MNEKQAAAALQQAFPQLDDGQISQICVYIRLLAEECERQNLTKYRTVEEILIYHVLDSLELVRHAVFKNPTLDDSQTRPQCVDIGSGCGSPGIPIQIAVPGLSMALLEARERRCDFLRRCVEVLDLPACTVLHGRAETFGRQSEYRGRFQYAIARAVMPLRSLLEISLPLLAPEGQLWVYQGGKWREELRLAENALKQLNGDIQTSFTYRLSGRDTDYALTSFSVSAPCPAPYPRSAKQITKRPL